MSGLHTSGSKSHAHVRHEMHEENGVVPRRDEQALKDAVEDHPEWTEKTVTQSDLTSHVLGPERNGYVRSIGKGPTPGDLEMPGKQKFRSTKLQMATEAKRQAEADKECLMEYIKKIESERDQKVDALSQEVANMKAMYFANSQEGRRVHISPQYESNSPLNESEQDESENGEAQSTDAENMFEGEALDRRQVPAWQRHELVGKEVILYSCVVPRDVPVAKATVISMDRMVVVGGTPLGLECCEVVVNFVMKRAAPLIRPYGNMSTMADTLGKSTAWLRQHIKEDRKSTPQQQASHL